MLTLKRLLAPLFLSGFLALSGCIPPVDPATLLSINQNDRRISALGTRTLAASKRQILEAGIGVLQDMGYELETVSFTNGFIVGKKKVTRRYSKHASVGTTISVMPLLEQNLATKHIVDVKKNRAMLSVSAAKGDASTPMQERVRVIFQYSRTKTVNGEIVYRRYRTTANPKTYQGFFAKLSKSLFLDTLNPSSDQ